jgi:hypothetical protein
MVLAWLFESDEAAWFGCCERPHGRRSMESNATEFPEIDRWFSLPHSRVGAPSQGRVYKRGLERGAAEMFARRGSLIGIVYLVVGIIVAASKNYLDIDNIRDVISAALGIVLWPLLLLDVNLRIGKLEEDGGKQSLLWLPVMRRAGSVLRRLVGGPYRSGSA